MDFPQVVVEAGFGQSNPYAVVGSWTDISTCADGSNRIRSISTSRGRQYELGDFETGTCEIVLANWDGCLDPLNQGGAYWPNVVPNVPLRVSAVYNSTTYRLFHGFAERWPPVRAGFGKHYSEITVTAVDAFSLFANYLWPLHDGGNGAGQGAKQLGQFGHIQNKWVAGSSFTSPDEAVRVYVLADTTYLTGAADAGPFLDDIVYKVTYTNGSGTTGRVGEVEVRHQVVKSHPASKWSDVLDMTLQGNDTVRSIQKVEVKSGKFHGSALTLRFYGERPIVPRGTGDAQLKSILKLCGWPNQRVTVRHAGRFTQIPSSPWGGTLLDSIRQIMETEIGQIYADTQGNIVFEDRDWRYNNWAGGVASTTWGDTAAYTRVYTDAQPDYSTDEVTTRWEVTRIAFGPNDNPVTQYSQVPNSQYGAIVGQRMVYLPTDVLAKRQAKYLLGRTKQPRVRIPSMTIKPLRDPSHLFPAVLGMEISDPIRVQMNPPNGRTTTYLESLNMNIDHISHTIDVSDPNTMWTTELELTPRITTAFPPS